MIQKIQKSDIRHLKRLNQAAPSKRPPYLISDYIHGNRIMPQDAPFPGKVDLSISAPAIEIMNRFSPYDPTRYIDVMSSAQVWKTFIIENVIMYGIGANPSPMLYVSGTIDLLKKWSKRLEPMLDSLGLRKLLRSLNQAAQTHGSKGDKAFQKIFAGGFLEHGSAQAPTSMRMESIKYLFLDETNSAPPMLTTGEGRFDLVAEARTKGWELKKKIGAFSTPTIFGHGDVIHKRFLLGDQNECFVPCPHCKKFNYLERGSPSGSYGLRAETEAGELKFVYYICWHCGDAIFEFHKKWMFPRYEWRPRAKAEKFRHSYHINSLYSPFGLYSWTSYWLDYQTAIQEPDGMRTFTNLQDGLPYREKGATPDKKKVIQLRGNYKEEMVPDHILYLTLAVDVQDGSKKPEEIKKGRVERLEIEIRGHSTKYRTASIVYKKFPGGVMDAYAGAWEDFYDWMLETDLVFRRRDGLEFRVAAIAADSGSGRHTHIVYEFCKRISTFADVVYPIKGHGHQGLKAKPDEGDPVRADNFKRFRPTRIDEETVLFMISTNYYKNLVYNNLFNSIKAIERGEDTTEKAGFCDFPMYRKSEYFDSLLNEEKHNDGSFHKIRDAAPNEGLDLFVYGMAIGDIYLDHQVLLYREHFRVLGWTKSETLAIDKKYVLQDMENAIKIEKKAVSK